MTDQYAVIGNPIAHSKSPLIHRMFAEQTGQDISYEAIEAPLDGFAATIERLRNSGYQGCNVTVPFKFEAFKLATQLSERAQSAQAVNTLKFDGNVIFGDNTDGAGLIRDIECSLGISLRGKRVLLMGAGGAAYGVMLPLLAAGANIIIANRTVEKAQRLATKFAEHGTVLASSYEALAGREFEVVVNATSGSLSDELPPLPRCAGIPPSPPFAKGGAEGEATFTSNAPPESPPLQKGGGGGIFAPGALAYDMMYGRETPFMRFAREHGAAIVSDGLGMLVEQAAESFFIWRGVRPDTAPVIAALRAAK